MSTLEAAEAVRSACIDAFLRAYEDAGVQGLCEEGRLEMAIGAVRSLELRTLIPQDEAVPADSRRP